MKTLMKVLLLTAFTSVIALTTALGQIFPGETWTLDENGLGLLTGPSLAGYSNGSLRQDPVSGVTTLYYNLGATSLAGDVLLLEPTTFATNDLLRFDGLGGLYFFSDREPTDPNPTLADVAQIPLLVQLGAVIFETGPEGNNSAFYAPTPQMPGSDTSGQLPGLMYSIISDVPEPGSTALLLAGAGLWGLTVLRRKQPIRP